MRPGTDTDARPAPRRRTLPARATFAASTAAFALVFASAGMPIPMYGLLREQEGLTDADFAFASVGYFVSAVAALLLLGRLSNHLGRRPIVIAAIALAAAGTALLPLIHDSSLFIVARILQGLSAGIAPSAIGALVIDTAPPRPRWLPALITGSTPMLGIPLGAMSAGLVVDFLPAPRIVAPVALLAALAVVAGLILASAETMPTARGALRSLRPRLQIPAGAGRILFATGSAAVATWSLGAFFQAFAPSLASTSLGSDDALLAAAVFSSMMVLNPIGGPLAARLSPSAGVRLGMTVFLIALGGIIVALQHGTVVPFLASSLVVGIAQGAASTSAMRALVTGLAPEERAGLLASVYLMSYTGSAVPGLIAGRVVGDLTADRIILGYAALGAVAAIVAMVLITDRRSPVEQPVPAPVLEGAAR